MDLWEKLGYSPVPYLDEFMRKLLDALLGSRESNSMYSTWQFLFSFHFLMQQSLFPMSVGKIFKLFMFWTHQIKLLDGVCQNFRRLELDRGRWSSVLGFWVAIKRDLFLYFWGSFLPFYLLLSHYLNYGICFNGLKPVNNQLRIYLIWLKFHM